MWDLCNALSSVGLFPAQCIHSSKLYLQSQCLCHTIQDGAWCATIGVLDLLVIRSGGYPNLFWVELIGRQVNAIHWAQNEFAPSLVHTQNCSIAFASLLTMMSNSLPTCLECAALSLFLVKSNNPAGRPNRFLGSLSEFLVKSPPHLVACAILSACAIQLAPGWMLLECLVIATPNNCFHCLPVSISFQVPLCSRFVIFYFLKMPLCFTLGKCLCLFKYVLSLFCIWIFPP